MFNYLTRKFTLLFQFPYDSKEAIKDIINNELSSLESPIPLISLTRNPFYCLKDVSEDIKYDLSTHKLIVCINLISSEEVLKGSLAREKY